MVTTPVTEHLIREMVEAIVAKAHPERVILFGSRAHGDAGEASDVDFIVVDSTRSTSSGADGNSAFGSTKRRRSFVSPPTSSCTPKTSSTIGAIH